MRTFLWSIFNYLTFFPLYINIDFEKADMAKKQINATTEWTALLYLKK